MSYAIICDARKGESLGIDILMLVDRGKSKQFWWTSDTPSIGICYKSKAAASFACNRLRKNNARVVAWESAYRAIHKQASEIMHNDACSDSEQGWDGHKS